MWEREVAKLGADVGHFIPMRANRWPAYLPPAPSRRQVHDHIGNWNVMAVEYAVVPYPSQLLFRFECEIRDQAVHLVFGG